MSIISKIKTFFKKTAGTPVKAPENLNSQTLVASVEDAKAIAKPIAEKPEKVKRSTFIWTFAQFIKSIGRFFRDVILLAALGYFIPEMRETLPYFYRFIDLILGLLEWISMIIWQVVGKFF